MVRSARCGRPRGTRRFLTALFALPMAAVRSFLSTGRPVNGAGATGLLPDENPIESAQFTESEVDEEPTEEPEDELVEQTVTNAVEGPYADLSKQFDCTIYFFEDGDNGLEEVFNGNYTFTKTDATGAETSDAAELDGQSRVIFALGHGESFTLDGVSAAAYFQIMQEYDRNYDTEFKDSEEIDPEDGVDTSNGGMKMRAMTPERVVGFTNTRADLVVSDFPNNDRSFVGLMAFAIGAAALVVQVQGNRRGVVLWR